MATRTISLDTEAYELLAAEKVGDESFSAVIKRKLRNRSTARYLLENVDAVCLSDGALDNVENLVRERRHSPANSPRLD